MKKSSTNWTVAGAVGAAIAASACCTIPLLLVSAGFGGAWVSTLTAFEPWRPVFILSAVALFTAAFYRRSKVLKKPDCDCEPVENPNLKTGLMIFLAVGSLALITSPLYLPKAPMSNYDENTIVVEADDVVEVVLEIDGMTCSSCTTTVSKALSNLRGVVKTEVIYDSRQAIVQFDASRLSDVDLTRATANAGYPSRVIMKASEVRE